MDISKAVSVFEDLRIGSYQLHEVQIDISIVLKVINISSIRPVIKLDLDYDHKINSNLTDHHHNQISPSFRLNQNLLRIIFR